MKKNSFYSLLIILISSCIFLNACSAGSPPVIVVSPTASAIQTAEQVTEIPTVGHFPETHLTLPSGLRIDEYALQSKPAGEPLVFVPVLDSQDEILAKHTAERQMLLPNTVYGPVLLNSEKLVAKEIAASSEMYAPLSVELILKGKTIYNTPAGVSSPSSGMKGLWSYGAGKHWALEIADLEMTPTTPKALTGKIIQDGKLTNDQIKAEETFGFQVFKDKPFYFFKRDDHISISYDGQETLLNYITLPHYNCCSLAALDSQQHPNMVAFFASKNGTWYYVEIGIFE